MVKSMASKTLIALVSLAGFVGLPEAWAQEAKGSQSTGTPVIHKDAITIKQKNRANTAKTKSGHKKTSGKTAGKDDWQSGASGGSKSGNGKTAKDGWQSGSTGGNGKTAKDGWQSGSAGGSKGGKGNGGGNDAWRGIERGHKGNGKTTNDNWQTGTADHPSPTHKKVVKSDTWVEGGKTANPQPGAPKSDQPK